ncbi:hypothetical protein A7985_17995 [Pseudoalteromonas luteoviolacea]|uniref:Uncharacterized protein n=1 Tax=Pseudoalteromonas luteoviolacea TaxID=43657 RepID=A0A1C0TNQ1_9GAMM|nr:hypothetical protein [Pseudoalteromonas luteoviolacea]MBQ4812193.1 hypothetical protein [Pseudoalteromonas luteoviolacea]OCQ20314.1 hypothetical protein A7985_17995 [Pseudoalteromonas luteoviolacea]
MNELLIVMNWGVIGLEVFVFAFLVAKFWTLKFNLFFGGKDSLKTIDDHELHSCFLTALCVLSWHFISAGLTEMLLSLELEKMKLRRLFYCVQIANCAAFAVVLYLLHSIRHCSFSRTAIYSMYITVTLMTVCLIQMVARGYFDYNGLQPLYGAIAVVCNLLVLIVVAKYPLSQVVSFKKSDKT